MWKGLVSEEVVQDMEELAKLNYILNIYEQENLRLRRENEQKDIIIAAKEKRQYDMEASKQEMVKKFKSLEMTLKYEKIASDGLKKKTGILEMENMIMKEDKAAKENQQARDLQRMRQIESTYNNDRARLLRNIHEIELLSERNKDLEKRCKEAEDDLVRTKTSTLQKIQIAETMITKTELQRRTVNEQANEMVDLTREIYELKERKRQLTEVSHTQETKILHLESVVENLRNECYRLRKELLGIAATQSQKSVAFCTGLSVHRVTAREAESSHGDRRIQFTDSGQSFASSSMSFQPAPQLGMSRSQESLMSSYNHSASFGATPVGRVGDGIGIGTGTGSSSDGRGGGGGGLDAWKRGKFEAVLDEDEANNHAITSPERSRSGAAAGAGGAGGTSGGDFTLPDISLQTGGNFDSASTTSFSASLTPTTRKGSANKPYRPMIGLSSTVSAAATAARPQTDSQFVTSNGKKSSKSHGATTSFSSSSAKGVVQGGGGSGSGGVNLAATTGPGQVIHVAASTDTSTGNNNIGMMTTDSMIGSEYSPHKSTVSFANLPNDGSRVDYMNSSITSINSSGGGGGGGGGGRGGGGGGGMVYEASDGKDHLRKQKKEKGRRRAENNLSTSSLSSSPSQVISVHDTLANMPSKSMFIGSGLGMKQSRIPEMSGTKGSAKQILKKIMDTFEYEG